MPETVNVEFVAMMDFQFKSGHPPTELTENFAVNEDDEILAGLILDYYSGMDWLWYNIPRNKTTLFGQRKRVFWSIPSNEGTDGVGQFMYLPQRGVGVATVWAFNPTWCSDPLAAKHSAWSQVDQWTDTLEQARLTNLEGEFVAERIYTMLIVRVDQADLTSFCHDNAYDVAAWFTGGLEREPPERKMALVAPESNMSQREYERIFMRWTDALALYNKTMSEEDYRAARCRAVQLFEHCVLARRIFRTDGEKIAHLSSSKRFFISFPRKFPQANRALSSFTSSEYEMVISPPVGFVEASELVRKAIKRCGVPRFIRDTRQSYDLLDRRLQLARGQWLGIIAFAAFLANAGIAIWIALLRK